MVAALPIPSFRNTRAFEIGRAHDRLNQGRQLFLSTMSRRPFATAMGRIVSAKPSLGFAA